MKENKIVKEIKFADFLESISSLDFFSWVEKETGRPFFTLEGATVENKEYKLYSSNKLGVLNKEQFLAEATSTVLMVYTLEDGKMKIGYPLVKGETVDLNSLKANVKR